MTHDTESAEIWNRILLQLRKSSSRESFENWLEPVRCVELDQNGALHLAAPNASAAQWLEFEFKQPILRTAEELQLPVTEVAIIAGEAAPVNGNGGARQQSFKFRDHSANFNSQYTFESFVVGSCNEFAHAAAQAVASNPARAYNPLYVYGETGMGKTHLMHAIGQRLLNNFPTMRVVYVSSEDFMNEMINSLRYDRMSSFHERFRSADALLVDDIQTLGSRERTQEEFFHTFNALHNFEKQIVISSDVAPKQLPGIVERLRSRFAWGLMADIQAPDLETKMAILDRKAEEAQVELPDAVRSFLATRLTSNIRELQGALIRLIAIASVSDSEITVAMARQALESILGSSERKASFASIQHAVAEHFSLRPQQLRERSNARAISYPRQIAMYVSKELLGASLPEIGKAFGGKHHTTVLHAVNKIERRRQTDSDLHALIHKLSDRFS